MFAVFRHQLPRRCPRLLADHQRVDHGPADVRDPQQPDAGFQGPVTLYLERLLQARHARRRRSGTRRDRNVVKAIVSKGRDRSEFERKFINGLTKAGLAAQADGPGWPRARRPRCWTRTAPRVDRDPEAAAASGSPVAAPVRDDHGQGGLLREPKTSLEKTDEPQDASRRPAGRVAPSSPAARSSGARPSPDSARARSGPSPRPE